MRYHEAVTIATGVILVIVGLLDFAAHDYPAGFSWFIFGSMYLVMESASKEQRVKDPLLPMRTFFGWAGLAASLLLLVYTVAF